MFPADNKQLKDDKNGLLVNGSEDFEAVSSDDKEVVGDNDKLISRAINATIVLGAGTFAVTRLLTIDHDYWHVSDLIYWILFVFVLFCSFLLCFVRWVLVTLRFYRPILHFAFTII